MGGLLAGLFGANGAAANAGNYYTNAAGMLANSTGSPTARIFTQEQNAALQPQFTANQNALEGNLAAAGILNSGAGSQAWDQLGSNEAATLAGIVAPLYQNAESQYGSIIGQMPGAQLGAYNSAIEQGIQGLQGIGSVAGEFFGVPGGGGGGANSAATGSYNPYAAGTGAATGSTGTTMGGSYYTDAPAAPVDYGPTPAPYGYGQSPGYSP